MQRRFWPWLWFSALLLCLHVGVSCSESFAPTEPFQSTESRSETTSAEPDTHPQDGASLEFFAEPEAVDAGERLSPEFQESTTEPEVADINTESTTMPEPVVEESHEFTAETVPEPNLPQSVTLEGGVSLSFAASGQGVTITYQGMFKDRKNLSIHYGFDGWNSISGRSQTQQSDGTGNDDFYQQQAMTPIPASQGTGFQVTLSLPVGRKALHFVFYTETPQVREWDNNQNKDFNVGLLFPYIGPYLTWNDNTPPSSGLMVSFVTAPVCIGRVDYGTTVSLGMQITEAQPRQYHHIALNSLQPATTYFYKVSCTDGQHSPVYSFRTAPHSSTTLKFIAMSDMQDNGETGRWEATAQELLVHHADIDFVIIAGDLPWNDRPGLWWTFFDKARALFATKVMMPVPGNHDTPTVNTNPDTSSFQAYFPLSTASGSATYHAFRYGPALFLGLNSEWPDQIANKTGKQYLWTQQVLQQSSTSPPTWTFAYWHHPPYNVGNRHWGAQGNFRDITALFDGKVDWVFCGHEHLYQRMKPLRYNATLATSGYGLQTSQGVGYIVLPPAGAWPNDTLIDHASDKAYYRDRLAYPVPPTGQNRVSSENGFVRVDISGLTFSLKTYGVGTSAQPTPTRMVDQLTYTR